MRAVVQRVRRAEVRVEGGHCEAIGKGLVLLVGVARGDAATDVEYTAAKVAGLRIFEDADGKMNLDIKEAEGELLLVSQFTLLGDLRKGRRPSFEGAETPEAAEALYNDLIGAFKASAIPVRCGSFGARMEVELVNDGPVTVLLDSRKAL